MIAELYDALIEAGASEAKARAAAEALAAHDQQFASLKVRFDHTDARLGQIDAGLDKLEARADGVEHRLVVVERRLAVLTWQVGIMAAALIVIGLPALWLLVRVAAKVGALPV